MFKLAEENNNVTAKYIDKPWTNATQKGSVFLNDEIHNYCVWVILSA